MRRQWRWRGAGAGAARAAAGADPSCCWAPRLLPRPRAQTASGCCCARWRWRRRHGPTTLAPSPIPRLLLPPPRVLPQGAPTPAPTDRAAAPAGLLMPHSRAARPPRACGAAAASQLPARDHSLVAVLLPTAPPAAAGAAGSAGRCLLPGAAGERCHLRRRPPMPAPAAAAAHPRPPLLAAGRRPARAPSRRRQAQHLRCWRPAARRVRRSHTGTHAWAGRPPLLRHQVEGRAGQSGWDDVQDGRGQARCRRCLPPPPAARASPLKPTCAPPVVCVALD